MSGSSQKFIARNRAPRVQIEYDVELYGAEKKVQLPFVMGVMSDLSGKSADPLPPVADRKFLEIDVDNFDDRMKQLKPRAAFSVPNTLSGDGNLSVDLTFEKMEDFSPAAIARKVEPLRKLLEARTQLSNLMTYMDGKTGAENLIHKLMQDPTAFRAIAGVGAASGAAAETDALEALRQIAPEVMEPGEDSGTASALASLKAAAPSEAEQPKDEASDALASLRQVEVAEPDQADEKAEALASLRAVDVEQAVETDPSGDALESLRSVQVDEQDAPDEAADALASLREADIAEAAATDERGDALATLREVEVTDTPDEDLADGALASLRDVEIEDTTEPDVTGDALASLREVEAVETPEINEAEDAIASLRNVEVDDSPAEYDTSDALASLRDVKPAEPQEDDETADALSSLREVEVSEETSDDDAGDALASLRDVDVVEEAVEDASASALGSLRDVEITDAEEPDETGAALEGLRSVDVVEDEVEDGSADALSSLRDLDVAEVPEEDELGSALDGLREADLAEEPDEDGSSSALDSLREVDVEDADETDEAGAALDALRSIEVAEEDVDDGSAAALGSLREVDIADEPEDDALGSALDGLREVEVAEEPEDDGSPSALESLRDVEVDQPEIEDASSATLDALRDLEIEDASEEDPVGDALDSLKAVEVENAAAETDAADALESLLADDEGPGLEASTDLAAELEDSQSVQSDEDDAGADDLDALLADDGDGGANDLDALLADDNDELDALLADDDQGGADDLDALLADDGDGETDDLDALLADDGDGGTDDLDALLADDGDGDGDTDDLDALLADDGDSGTDDLDALLADDGDGGTDDLDALLADDGDGGTDDLDALLADDGDSGTDDLDALLADDGDGGTDDLDALLADDGDGGTDDLDALLADDGAASELEAAAAETVSEAASPPPVKPPEPDYSFGTMSAPALDDSEQPKGKFRIAILGDFSGRASRGEIEIGEGLRGRKPMKFDIDNAEDMIARFRTTLTLPIGEDGAGVEVALNSLDDLHPDELYDNVDMFEELSTLRRRVSSGRDLDRVVAEMKGWGEEFGDIKLHARKRAKGVAVPADRRLSDFQQLIGDMREPQVEASDADDLIQRIVGPHIVAAADPQQETMVKMLDDALSAAMRTVLHHPDFQAVESLWRSLDLLARRIETSASMEIVLYDVSAEEWAGDLSAQDEMGESGLYKMLVEEPRLDAQHGPLSAVFGLYTLEETPPHAELMARMAKICAHMQVPFVTSISPQFLQTPKKDRHPLTAKTWDALRALPEASYVGLVSPRFLLRLPYGQKTEPVYPFEFEEFTLREGLKGMLWANPVVLVAILMAETARTTGKKMELGKIMSLGDMPFHFMTDEYGDQVGLPCTERLLNTTTAAEVVARGFMPVLSMKGQNQVRLGSFQSLGKGQIAGVWAPVAVGAAAGASVEMSAGEPAPSGADDSGLGDAGEDDVATGDDDLGLDDLDSGGDDSDDLGDLDDLLADFGDDAGGDEDDTDLDAELAALLGDL